jgi:hypothetical protein
LSADEQKLMQDLKFQAIFDPDPLVKRGAVDALASHGKKSVNLLQEVSNSAGIDNSLKIYILSKITQLNIFSPPGKSD